MLTKEDFLSALEKKPRTRSRLETDLGYGRTCVTQAIMAFRSDIVITDYEQPSGKGRPAPIYGRRTSPAQQDVLLVKAERLSASKKAELKLQEPKSYRLDTLLCGTAG